MSSSSSSLNPTRRSRTLLFLSYRDSRAGASRSRRSRIVATYDEAQNEDDEHERLINADSGHISIDADLPPKWVDIADQVKEIIAGIQTKIAALDKLHAKHVLPGFSDRTAEEREIEASTTDITKDFRQCSTLIQRIGSVPTHTFPPSHTGGSSHHHELAAKNVQRGLAAKVQELSATFRKKQRVYMEKLQGHAIKNQDLLAASGAVSLKGSAGMSALAEDMEAAAQSNEGVVLRLAALDDGLQTRDRELTEIAKSIAQLAELFKDLSALVIDQGTLLDSVEYNIEQTAVQMEDAVRELDTATRYQKNTGRRQCIFLLLLIIFGLIIVLIFKPRRDHSPPALPPAQPTTPAAAVDALRRASGTLGTPSLGVVETPHASMRLLRFRRGVYR
ncbi:t-SNARE [Ganoderma leucocontextum]|nr:t-SNARE [Ganoderma leucocontextum]